MVHGLLVVLALVAVAACVAFSGAAPASPWRHLYHVPVVLAALRFERGGTLTALAAVLLHAPFVLPAIERAGARADILEGLVTFALLLGGGALADALAGRARRERARHETLVAVQRALEGARWLDLALGRARACLLRRIRADALGLVAREGDRLTVVGAPTVAPGSAVARVLTSGRPVFVPDVGGDRRARRLFVAPLETAAGCVGALAIERLGDIPVAERGALQLLAAHVGMALEHARLTARQQRFAEELEARVAEATRRVGEIDRMKSEFVAIASHELRTPLTALQGFSELLAMRAFAPDEVTRLAGIMRGETERLSRIVSDFLDLARLERGLPPPLRPGPLDIGDVVESALEVFRRARPTHTFELEREAALPQIEADGDAVDRVVKNLVSNAVKYSSPGSRVGVAVRRLDGAVEIAVEDEGPGLAETDLARVFEPYYRAPGAATAARGTGLGLAVVRSLVEAHGGTVRAENRPARGARFTLRLPVGGPAATAPRDTDRPPAPRTSAGSLT